ncbi:hypothetical protein Vretimale_9056, partial [Volvox reticuliferus]
RQSDDVTSAAPPVALAQVPEVPRNRLKELEGQMLELQNLQLQLEKQQREQEEELQKQQQRGGGGDQQELAASWPASGAGPMHQQQQPLQLQVLQEELVKVLKQVRDQQDAVQLQHQQLEAQYHRQLQLQQQLQLQLQQHERSRGGEPAEGENALFGFENGVSYAAVADAAVVQSAASAAGEAEVLNVPTPDLTSWEPLPLQPPPPPPSLRGAASAWSKWPRPPPPPPLSLSSQPYVIPPGYALVSNEIVKP